MFPLWSQLDGRPVDWDCPPGPPRWRAWMRLVEPLPPEDRVLGAAESLLWLDLAIGSAIQGADPWPFRFFTPNLDLTAQFHRLSSGPEWRLCEGFAPVACEGLVASQGRVWSPEGQLLASGTAQLLCRPNRVAQGLARGAEG